MHPLLRRLEANAHGEQVGVESYIGELDSSVGNMEKPVIDGVSTFLLEIFQPGPGMKQKLELTAQFPCGEIFPVSH